MTNILNINAEEFRKWLSSQNGQSEKPLDPKSIKGYSTDVSGLLTYLGDAQVSLDELNNETICAYFSKNGGIRESTVRRKLASFGYLSSFMESKGMEKIPFQIKVIINNLASKFQDPKDNSRKITEPEFLKGIEKILKQYGGENYLIKRDVLLVSLVFRTGVQIREAVSLNIENIAFSENNGNSPLKVDTQYPGRNTSYEITGLEANTIRNYGQVLEQYKTKLGIQNEPALFLNKDGNRITTRSGRRIVEFMGIQGNTKSLRKSFLSRKTA